MRTCERALVGFNTRLWEILVSRSFECNCTTAVDPRRRKREKEKETESDGIQTTIAIRRRVMSRISRYQHSDQHSKPIFQYSGANKLQH